MDPRMKQVLLVLLQLTLERELGMSDEDGEENPEDPLGKPAPEKKRLYAPGTLGYDLKQLGSPEQKRIWPPATAGDHNFGGP